jgi:hypothetical protein
MLKGLDTAYASERPLLQLKVALLVGKMAIGIFLGKGRLEDIT